MLDVNIYPNTSGGYTYTLQSSKKLVEKVTVITEYENGKRVRKTVTKETYEEPSATYTYPYTINGGWTNA
jgi:hypothetical protein